MVDRRRLWRAENQNISIEEKITDSIFNINGSRDIEYRVDLNKHTCECPDWQKNQPRDGCKHILKIKLEQGLIDPLPSAKTDSGQSDSKTVDPYPENWDKLSQQTLLRDNWKCQKCGRKGGPHGSTRVEAHHIIPRSKGGEDRIGNLITLCHSCHEKEHGHSIPKQNSYSTNSNLSETQQPDQDRNHGISERSEQSPLSNTDQQDSELTGTAVKCSQEWWHFVALAHLAKHDKQTREVPPTDI